MPDEESKWKLKKEVSLGDVIAIVVAMTAVLMAYARLDGRVTIVEITAAQNAASVLQIIGEVRTELRRLSDKMDRYVERGGRQ